MAFSAKQLRALQRKPDHRHIRTREAHGRELTYLEGWYAISEANRIFGFDGWSRETIESRCVLAREIKGTFLAVYLAKVRLTVTAEGATIIREGHGTGEGRGVSPGEVHDVAVKAAETDATKRALATFGRPFGLELYRSVAAGSNRRRGTIAAKPLPDLTAASTSPVSTVIVPVGADPRVGFHPDDTTPIPRPSRYYGRRDNPLAQHFRNERRRAERAMGTPMALPLAETTPSSPPLALSEPHPLPGCIDKSQLAIAEPKRLRDKNHLKFVAAQPCLVCGRQPCDPHHLRFAQPRALGLKVSDEFTVPLCRGHHRQLHQAGNEVAWWGNLKINALEIAKGLWEQTRPKSTTADVHPNEDAAKVPAEK
jgi:Rad52/22 family double-strand break repair protein